MECGVWGGVSVAATKALQSLVLKSPNNNSDSFSLHKRRPVCKDFWEEKGPFLKKKKKGGNPKNQKSPHSRAAFHKKSGGGGGEKRRERRREREEKRKKKENKNTHVYGAEVPLTSQ